MEKVKIFNKSQNPYPEYKTALAAGMDICADITENITLNHLERKAVPTGIFMALPKGYECQVRPRSGLAANHGITVLNSPGTIDADYRGEVKVILVNLSNEPYTIVPGERIAQLVFAKAKQIRFEDVMFQEDLGSTERGSGAFGSTGKK